MSEQLELGPPPVESLSDVAWARVERGLWARLDADEPAVAPPSRRWLYLAAPAIAAAAGVALWLGFRGTPVPHAGVSDDPLIFTTSGAPSTVSAGDAHISLEAESKVVMSRETPTAMVERGAAWFQVAPRGQQPPFVVVAGDTVVRVIGTRFRVARYAEITTVTVEHGLVDVRFRGDSVQVAGGQSWSSDKPNAISTTMRTAAHEPAPARATPPPPVPVPAAEPDETTMPPVRARPPAKPVTPPPAVASKTVDPDETKFNQLAALESRDPAVALAGYLELSRGNGKWAAVGLYAAGRLAMDLHDPRAQTFLKIYLRRFPKGKNADDARKLLEGDHR